MRGSVCLFLLSCAVCVSPAQEQKLNTKPAPRPPTGVFESVEKFTRGTNSPPLFTLHLETNGTYRVECSMPDFVQGIDGGGAFCYTGRESGAWEWDSQNLQIVLKVNKSDHMSRWFPRVLRASERDLDRLEAVNIAPQGTQTSGHLWLPLFPASFNRTGE